MTDPPDSSPDKKLPLPDIQPFYMRSRFVIAMLFAMVIYVWGWKVTEIDLGELARDAHLVKPLITALLQPDVIAHETKSKIYEVEFTLGGNNLGDFFNTESTTQSPGLTVQPDTGVIGDRVTVEGIGLRPLSEGKLFWVNSIEQEFPLGIIDTGKQGSFVMEVTVPPTARGDVQYLRAVLTWPTGEWKISPTVKLVTEKMLETVFLGLMATSFAVVIAVPLSFLGARNLTGGNLTGKSLYTITRTLFNVLRSIEPLIMAILFAVWVGIGPFAGVLALGLHSIAALGKLFSEQIESIDPGPVEAITATGASRLQVVLYGVVPQVLPQFLALTFYRWDINVRMSTIIGFVGGGGIGFLLQQWINLLQYHQAGTALIAIAIVVITLDFTSARIREKITAV